MDQSQEILLGHAIFVSSEYGYRRIARSICNNVFFGVCEVSGDSTVNCSLLMLWTIHVCIEYCWYTVHIVFLSVCTVSYCP